MSSCLLMFPGVRSFLVLSNFGFKTPASGPNLRAASDPVTWSPHPGPSARHGDAGMQGVDSASTDALPEGEVRDGWTRMVASLCSPTSRCLGPFSIFRSAPGPSPSPPGPSSPPSAALPWMRVPERRRYKHTRLSLSPASCCPALSLPAPCP